MNIKNDVLESDVSDIKKAYLRPTQLSEVLFEDIKGILESKFPTVFFFFFFFFQVFRSVILIIITSLSLSLSF